MFSARHHPCLSSRGLKASGNAPEHDDGEIAASIATALMVVTNGGDKLQALDECGVGDFEQHEPRLDA